MKEYYSVSFQYSESVFCANIAHGEKTAIEEHYKSQYEWVSIKPASQWEIDDAKRKGMPIVEI